MATSNQEPLLRAHEVAARWGMSAGHSWVHSWGVKGRIIYGRRCIALVIHFVGNLGTVDR